MESNTRKTEIPTRKYQEDLNTKYVTFNREEFDQFTSELENLPLPIANNTLAPQPPAEIFDAVVIRRQDIFASPALHAYACTIETAIEIIRNITNHNPAFIAPTAATQAQVEQLARLRYISSYFHEQAELAALAYHKIPD